MSSGLYQCVASNAIGTSTCLLDLQVIARKYFARGGLATCFCLVTVRCVTMFAVSHHVPLYQKIIMPWNGNIAFLPSQATVASCAYRWPQPIPDFFMLCSIISTAHPRSIGLIAGAVATGAVVLVVCIVLVAVALFYWKNKHKEEEEEEIPNEIR